MSRPIVIDEATAAAQPRMRPMRLDDVERVLQIEQQAYSMPWSEATFRGLLRRRDAELVVLEVEERVVGYTASWYVLDQAELGNVAVAARWRGRGFGALLVESALLRAERYGAREIFLEVRPSNASARRLYTRFGFREVGRRAQYYSRPTEDALVMRRSLGPDHPIPSP